MDVQFMTNLRNVLWTVWCFCHLKSQIACQYLHFAKTEDIWLKSALEGKSGVSLITGRKSQKLVIASKRYSFPLIGKKIWGSPGS